MTGQELLEWLQALPEEERRESCVQLETPHDDVHLVTAKFQRSRTVHLLHTIYLVYK